MITPWNIYWITRLDGISNFISVALVLCFILAAILVVITLVFLSQLNDLLHCYGQSSDKVEIVRQSFRTARRWLMILLSVMIATGLIMVLIPTTKEMAAIMVIPRVANSQTVNELGQNVKELALDWLEELKPSKARAESEAE